jgi:hypothetical protein
VEKAAKLANAWLVEIDSNFQWQIKVSNCKNFVGGEIYAVRWFNEINKPVGRFLRQSTHQLIGSIQFFWFNWSWLAQLR